MVYLAYFIFGAIVGSFLNALTLRLGTGLSIYRGRSMCFTCGHKLSSRELVPIVSYLIQKGYCLHCKAHISLQYPLVEIMTGLGFVILASKVTSLGLLFLALTTFSLSVAICIYDLRHKIVPDSLAYSLLAVGLLSFVVNRNDGGWTEFVAGPIAALFFASLWFFSDGKWMGLGDAKLALAMGFFLGARGIIEAIFMAFWSGAIVGIVLLLLCKNHITIKSEIPFAPFLLGAMFLEILMPPRMHFL